MRDRVFIGLLVVGLLAAAHGWVSADRTVTARIGDTIQILKTAGDEWVEVPVMIRLRDYERWESGGITLEILIEARQP